MRIWISILLVMAACGGNEEPPPPPAPKPKPPSMSLIPTAKQLEVVVNQMDKDVATEEVTGLVQYAGDKRSQENTILALVAGSTNPKVKVRGNVAYAMEGIARRAQVRDERLVDALLVMVNDADPWVQVKAVDALSRFCNKKTVPILIDLLDDKKQANRAEAARQALETMSGQKGLKAGAWKKWWVQGEATFEAQCLDQK